MRNLLALVTFCVGIAIVTTLKSVSAGESMPSGSPPMFPKNHPHLIGTWNCEVAFPASEGQKAFKAHPKMTISDSPNMTLHIRFIHVGQFMSDYYAGYDTKLKTYWMNAVDTQGGVVVQTSKDGVAYNGTASYGAERLPIRDTWTAITDSKLRNVTEIQEHGKWTQNSEAVCTKT